jgi:hypothetical protein
LNSTIDDPFHTAQRCNIAIVESLRGDCQPSQGFQGRALTCVDGRNAAAVKDGVRGRWRSTVRMEWPVAGHLPCVTVPLRR